MPPITLPPASVRRELTADDPAVIVNALHFYADGIRRQIDAIECTPIPLSDLLDPASAQKGPAPSRWRSPAAASGSLPAGSAPSSSSDLSDRPDPCRSGRLCGSV